MPGPGLHPDAGWWRRRRRRSWPRWARKRQAAAHASGISSETRQSWEPAAIELSYPILPVAAFEHSYSAVERHHSLVPLAAEELHAVVPLAASGIHHSLVPSAAIERHHSFLPLATAGITHHSVIPLAAVERHHPLLPPLATTHHAVLPLTTQGLPHAVVPITTLKLQHPILPLAAAWRADPVLPVATQGLFFPNSSDPRAAPADLRGRAGLASRAAAGLVRPHPLDATVPRLAVSSLDRPPHAVATHRAPRLRPAAARAGDPLLFPVPPRHPVDDARNAAVEALLAAAPGREPRHRHRR